MPVLPGHAVACLTRARSELPVQNGHSAPRQQTGEGPPPSTTVPGRTKASFAP